MPRFRAAILTLMVTPMSMALLGQEARLSVELPMTLSGGLVRTQQFDRANQSRGMYNATEPGFRALLRPGITLGRHWLAYSAIQVDEAPYSWYQAYTPGHRLQARLMQGFAGYKQEWDGKSITVKAGRLPSAFGSFPLRYEDTQNPLIDVPLLYNSYAQVRSDQLPCGVGDFAFPKQIPYFAGLNCGPRAAPNYGLFPVTLYGIPGAQADVSYGQWDGRFQLTNSSPANPQGITRTLEAQWTAGAGRTIRQGFRVGVSAYRGGFLDQSVQAFLPGGATTGNFPATGVGIDAQWAQGRWSAQGEWGRFQFDYPNFRVSPAMADGYAEVKAIVTPRLYAAARGAYRRYNRIADRSATTSQPFLQNRWSYEMAVGYRLNRWQLFKVGYERLNFDGLFRSIDFVGVQFVTSFTPLSKAIL